MSLTARVLIGLVAGFVAGLALAASPPSVASSINAVAGPIGILFVNLIRMTMLPLVVSMLIARIGALHAGSDLRRTSVRAALFAFALLTAASLMSLVVAQPIVAHLAVGQAAPLAPAGGAPGAGASGMPSLSAWLIDLVPLNPVKSAADGAMLPVIVFSLLFAVALAQAAPEPRAALLRVVEGIADAMQRLVTWILALAPIGVFALAIPLASRMGLSAAGALAAYVVLVVALTVAFAALVLYPTAFIWGALAPRAFVSFCAPAQAVAFASRSSLASLPAMVESAERVRLAPIVAGFVLPLGASVFRVGGAVGQTVGVLVLARMYGMPLGMGQYAALVATAVLTTFAVPGVPGGSIIAMVPVLAAVGLPADGAAILLAVDAIPDMFRTTANVTGSMVLASVTSHARRSAAVREPSY